MRLAASTLGHLDREYPNGLRHVLDGPADIRSPRSLHPVFFGSYDWHSCVHGWWQVFRIVRRFPGLPLAAEVETLAARTFTPGKVEEEVAYFLRPVAGGFERPYGWAWLLALHDELGRHPDPSFAAALAPLAELIAERFTHFLAKLAYPVRHGVHSNTAFALILAHAWASSRDRALAASIGARALAWFADDCALWTPEPSGEDFLSPTLCEAQLMLCVLGDEAFRTWFGRFLPRIPSSLLTPAVVTDRADGRLAHLDGLNLSRAWAWRTLGRVLDDHRCLDAAEAHLASALPHLADHYMGEHWLATFALLALDTNEVLQP